jgi:hypothetical protein
MATTTPNYLWSVPTSSDLVKNGATAIETLGDSVDASLWNSGYGQAGKNKIINGDFSINQRSFSSTTGTGYGLDRWLNNSAGDGTTTFSTQAFTTGTAPVAGYESTNFLRIVTTGQTTAAVFSRLDQKIENVRTFAGQSVTVSFWAKAASGTPSIAPEFQQVFGSGGSPSATVNGIIASTPKQAITTSWARYSFNIAIPSISGKTIGTANDSNLTLGLYVSAGSNFNARTGTLGIQSNTFEVWGVQVEYGSYATPFQTASGGSPQAELAMCQRYYFRNSGDSTNDFILGYTGTSSTTTTPRWAFQPPVTMRTAPTSIEFANLQAIDAGAGYALSALAIGAGDQPNVLYIVGTSAALTAYRPLAINAASASAYLGISAEL